MYPQSMFWAKILKYIKVFFPMKFSFFLSSAEKNLYIAWTGFVMQDTHLSHGNSQMLLVKSFSNKLYYFENNDDNFNGYKFWISLDDCVRSTVMEKS